MALELTDPQTGQIKTSVIVIGGIAGLGLLLLLGRSGSSAPSGVVSNGQSSGISDQLGALSGAVAGLAAQDQGTGAGTTGGGSSTSTSTTSGSGTGAGTGTGSGSSNTGSSGSGAGGSGSNTPPAGNYSSWLTDLISRIGSAHRTNPTNPISSTTFAPGTAFANLPGGILPGLSVSGLIGSGQNGAYQNFISQYTGGVNVNSPQNPSPGTTNLGDKLSQVLHDLQTGNFQDIASGTTATSGAGGGSGGSADSPSNSVGTVQNPNAPNPVPVSLFTNPAFPSLPSFSGQYSTLWQNYQNLLQPNVQPLANNATWSNLLTHYRTATIQPVP